MKSEQAGVLRWQAGVKSGRVGLLSGLAVAESEQAGVKRDLVGTKSGQTGMKK